MNLLEVAQSGHGKSWLMQALLEENITSSEYDGSVIFDFKDEFVGLAYENLARHYIVGEIEAEWSQQRWLEFLSANPYVILARVEDMPEQDWRELVGDVVRSVRSMQRPTLLGIDEAHFVAPQKTKIPDPVKGLATTGRGEQVSVIWTTQQLQRLDETVIGQSTDVIAGGFRSKRDRKKLADGIEYTEDAHKQGGVRIPDLPEALHAPDDGAISVRKFTDSAGNVVGSEWLYSNEHGEMRRIDTREMSMRSTHHGKQGRQIQFPDSNS